MICSVPSRCWEIAKERISSSVITPPALRITCASPIESPRIGYGFSRASMQATIATFLAGGSGRSPLSKASAKAALFFRNSSMALISPPFGNGSSKHAKDDPIGQRIDDHELTRETGGVDIRPADRHTLIAAVITARRPWRGRIRALDVHQAEGLLVPGDNGLSRAVEQEVLVEL